MTWCAFAYHNVDVQRCTPFVHNDDLHE